MKRSLPFFLSLIIISLTTTAQDETPFRKYTYLKVNPSTIISSLDIYLEQDLTEKLSLELGVGGIYTDYPDYVFLRRVDIGQKKPGISTEQLVEGRGLAFRAGMKWYLIRQQATSNARGTYFEPVLFYKRIFYPKEDVTINNQTFQEPGNKNVYGLQLLLGRQMRKDKYVIDPYLGIGVRSKVYHYTEFSQTGGNINRDDTELRNILPSIHLGIKIGLAL